MVPCCWVACLFFIYPTVARPSAPFGADNDNDDNMVVKVCFDFRFE